MGLAVMQKQKKQKQKKQKQKKKKKKKKKQKKMKAAAAGGIFCKRHVGVVRLFRGAFLLAGTPPVCRASAVPQDSSGRAIVRLSARSACHGERLDGGLVVP